MTRRQVTDAVHLEAEAGSVRFRCTRCSHDLGPSTENYKLKLLLERSSVTAIPGVGDPRRYGLSSEVEFRRFYCPGCARQIEAELSKPEDEILWTTEMHVEL